MKKVYFAGGLFDHKELCGNLLLAEQIRQLAGDRYELLLPQNFESSCDDAIMVRNNDYRMVISCDMILANFDGLELDSGTVAEFCCAKMLDMPAVLLRTDFRGGGERSGAPDPWNLMLSGYPRSKSLRINAMDELVRFRNDLTSYHSFIASQVINAMDKVSAAPSLLPHDPEALFNHYRTVMRLLGSGMEQMFSDEELRRIIHGKLEHGVY